LDGVSKCAVEHAVYLIQAVLGEAALAHPPIGGLDVRSGEPQQRDIAEILAQAPNVELIALVGAGPDPLARQLQPTAQENPHRHFACTDWQTLSK
jgi:hypothetical protein